MVTPTQSVQIGEILVPGAELYGARTFMLTRPTGPDPREVELVFGLLAGETKRQVVDQLVERVVEAARTATFTPEPDPEQRYEAALKRINSVILGYLHEQGLSLPGTKLRGAFGLLTGHDLFLAGRGSFQGHIILPQEGVLTPYEIFSPAADWTNPKFFAAYQRGPMSPGSRLYISSTELFETLGDDFVLSRFRDPDPNRAARELKAALRTTKLPIALMSLVMPPAGQIEAEQAVSPVAATPASGGEAGRAPERAQLSASTSGGKAKTGPEAAMTSAPVAPVSHQPAPRLVPSRPRPSATVEQVADVGGLVSRGAQAAVNVAANGLKSLPRGISVATTGAASAASRTGRLLRRAYVLTTAGLRDEQGRLRPSKLKEAPTRLTDSTIRGLNAVPERWRLPLLALILAVAVLFNGAAYLAKRQSMTRAAHAYETQLAEVQRLETEIESARAYGNEDLVIQDIQALRKQLAELPTSTSAQRKAKAAAEDFAASTERRLRKEVLLKPLAYSDLGQTIAAPGAVAWWNGKLYAFSSTEPQVAVIGDGLPAKRQLSGQNRGIIQALPAVTGIILVGQDGRFGFWDPATNIVRPYTDVANNVAGPVIFYEGRIYQTRPDSGIVRQSILDGKLGSPVVSLSTPIEKVSGLAADGALYLLTADGHVSKYIKGTSVAVFKPTTPNPPATAASNLIVEQDGKRLLFLDKPSGRLFILDKQNGAIVATAVDESLKGLTSWSLDESGDRLFLAFGSKIQVVKLSDLKP